jgi:hypothetical protein
MMLFYSRLLSLLVGILVVTSASANCWQVVVNQSTPVSHLSQLQVQAIYTQHYQVNGETPTLIDLADEALRTQFYQEVVGMSLNRWRAHWARLVFTGQGNPPAQLSIEQTLSAVQKTINTVAYIPFNKQVPSGVKVVYVYEGREGNAEQCLDVR